MRALPVSLSLFVVAAVVFAVQLEPLTGVLLAFLLGPFWSVVLINAGMIGTGYEAITGRVSRWWLVLPVVCYGAYFSIATADHIALRRLGEKYAAANARVAVPFDPRRQALVFERERSGNKAAGSYLIENYRLPVTYLRNSNDTGFQSIRLVARAGCTAIAQDRASSSAGIITSGYDPQFCELRMPDQPDRPPVTIASRETGLHEGSLPITRLTTAVRTPDGRNYVLLGGMAAPLSWLPMPVMGCVLGKCGALFWRSGFTPIIPGGEPYHRDADVLARALGLARIGNAVDNRSDAALTRARVQQVKRAALERQLAAIDRMIADPLAPVKNGQTGVVANRPEVLAAKADAIMAGLERAVAARGKDQWKARESGRILAALVAVLPEDRFISYVLPLTDMYRTQLALSRDGRTPPWLWEERHLLGRMCELGPDAMFVVNADEQERSANRVLLRSMCRFTSPPNNQ